MITLFTDFGSQDPYVGQLHTMLVRHAPGIPIIDLFHHVPNHDIRAGAYLLPNYISAFPEETIFMCVVDPGVGGERRPLIIRLDNSWFVGPDNGLFQILARRASQYDCYAIDWRPDNLSQSFHGRDLFAPVAAMLALGNKPDATAVELSLHQNEEWPDDLNEILYIDHFGNAISGYRAANLSHNSKIEISGYTLQHANTFSDVEKGKPFWFENANGLVELAINQGSATNLLSLSLGASFTISS